MRGKKSSNPDYNGRGSGRTRNWSFLVYADSAPEDWRTILDSFNVPWIESPYHSEDKNPDGTEKKPHWHILIMFDSVKSYEQVCAITDMLNTTIPQKCLSTYGLVRYMVHLDNPEKYQYSLADIVPHQGADITEFFLPSKTQRLVYLHEIFDYIDDNHIIYFSDLLDYARLHKPDTWFVTLTEGYSILFTKYFSSLQKKIQDRGTLINKI